MAIHKSEYYRLNGTSWDLYLFRTTADMVEETTERKFATRLEKNRVENYLATFNVADKLVRLNTDGEIPIGLIPGGLDYLPIAGGTMTGNLNFLGDRNIVNVNKITKLNSIASIDFSAQDELLINGKYRFDNSTLNMGGNRIENVGDPSFATDAVTKQWVQQYVAQGTHVVGAARVATTGGAITELKGTPTIDGITLSVGDRVLVKNQESIDATQNGLYRVNSGAWSKLPEDSDKGSLVFVTEGITNRGKQYYNLNGTTWELFFVQDTYHATLDRGLEVDGTGFGFGIAEGGIYPSMLRSGIPLNLLENMEGQGPITSGKTATWASFQSVVENASTTESKVNTIFKIMQKLRGTDNLLSNINETISGAYNKIRLKNKIDAGSTVPATPAGYDNGDVYLKILSTT